MSDIVAISEKIQKFSSDVVRIRALLDAKTADLSIAQAEQAALVTSSAELREVNALLEKCNITARKLIKTEIESLVTSAIQMVFEDPTMYFNIAFVPRRNQIEADFTISHRVTKDNIVEESVLDDDIRETSGGGVVDVVSTALRIILMELFKIEGPIILDEPGRMISEQYIDNFGKFLVAICKQFNRQIILITHNNRLAEYADNKIEL